MHHTQPKALELAANVGKLLGCARMPGLAAPFNILLHVSQKVVAPSPI
jgi:hypothetical protein